MTTAAVTINKLEWTRITDADQSGTCWKKTGGTIVVDHTDQETADTLPLSNVNVDVAKAKRAPLDTDSNIVLPLPSDNVADIFYALVIGAGNDTGSLVVDVI